MLVLVEGSKCSEGNATLANYLQRGQLEFKVEANRGNISPELWENDSRIAEGIKECAESIESKRQARVIGKLPGEKLPNHSFRQQPAMQA